MLYNYSWPGNVRELRNVVERAVLLCKTEMVSAIDIVLGRAESHSWEWDIENFTLPPDGFDFDKLRRLESHLLRQALAPHGQQSNAGGQAAESVARTACATGCRSTGCCRTPASRFPLLTA